MNRTGLSAHVRQGAHTRALLVLAVLAGVLAMHALAPGAMPPMDGHPVMLAAASAHGGGPATEVAGPAAGGCGHSSGLGSGGVMAHADTTCAAAGTSSSYAPPALTGRPALAAADAAPGPEEPVVTATSGRAPPDLSQLQLLRI